MQSLIALIDTWHPLAAYAKNNPDNPTAASDAADEARHALELRVAAMEGFASALSAHDSETGARLRFYLTGK